ncbi:MAG: nitroreductase [Hyphomicrobiaceae bacterium]|jgi:nitroreductase
MLGRSIAGGTLSGIASGISPGLLQLAPSASDATSAHRPSLLKPACIVLIGGDTIVRVADGLEADVRLTRSRSCLPERGQPFQRRSVGLAGLVTVGSVRQDAAHSRPRSLTMSDQVDLLPLTMSLEDAMRTQRAIRRLKPDPVDDRLLLHLIELALKAPTGSNAQNWEFIVVKNPAVKAKLGGLNRKAWNIYGPLGRRMAERSGDAAMLRIFPSVQNLLLAARAAGLGAALITLPLWSRFLARRALGLPWNVTPCAVVPMGWPIGKYGPTTRRPVGEIVSLDRYGNRPFAALSGVTSGAASAEESR